MKLKQILQLTVILVAMSASSAMAEDATNPTPVPQAPVVAVVPQPPVESEFDADKTPEHPAANAPEATSAAPQVVVAMPSPKVSKDMVEAMLKEFNGSNTSKVADLFAKEGFAYVTQDGELLKTVVDLQAHFSTAPMGAESAAYTYKVDSIQELANGVAFAVGGFNRGLVESHIPDGYFSTLLKYDGTEWKVVNFQVTPKKGAAAAAAEAPCASQAKTVAIALIVGAMLGIVLSKFMGRRR
jgi:hypothetical protein